MSELAAELRVDASAATRTVKRLVANGYASRAPGHSDARAVVVSLTDAGTTLVREIGERGVAAINEVLSDFTPAEQEQLVSLWERFVQGIDRARSASV